MTTDPVQEARDEVIATAHDVHTDAQLIVALDAYAAAIRREDAARVLSVLRAVEWGGREELSNGSMSSNCPMCHELVSVGHIDCTLGAEIARLEALVGGAE